MARKLLLLSVLYFVQGLPYGFQIIALPVYLRELGLSLTQIGLASALSLPWMLKFVWGPAVDRYGSHRFGRRRSWIVPLQLCLAMSCALAAFVEPSQGLTLLVLLVLLMNLCASTMDVAVDGLAVDLLEPQELGYGNIAQVVGYKLGMLTGGGLLVWASGQIGWRGLFLAMATLVALALLVTLPFREPRRPSASGEPGQNVLLESSHGLADVVRALTRTIRLPGAVWLLVFIATYKLGESMADAMFKPFLYDMGYTPAEIGRWLGTWGMAFSLGGSFIGGVLASRIGILRAVAVAACLRAGAVAGEWWLSLLEQPTHGAVVGVIAAEQAFGGMITTAIFALMMSRTDRRIGASHYTLLATVEVMGKLTAAGMSGYLAERLGYSGLFGLATVLAFGFLALIPPMARTDSEARSALEELADRPL